MNGCPGILQTDRWDGPGCDGSLFVAIFAAHRDVAPADIEAYWARATSCRGQVKRAKRIAPARAADRPGNITSETALHAALGRPSLRRDVSEKSRAGFGSC